MSDAIDKNETSDDISAMLNIGDITEPVKPDASALVPTESNTDIEKPEDVNDENANAIRFLDRMDDDKKSDLVSKAPVLLDNFLKNENRINHFGDKIIQQVNRVVDRQLEQVSKEIDYPEINKMIRDMTGDFDESVTKYEKNTSFDLVQENETKLKRWFREKIETFKRESFDAKPLLDRFDYVKAKLSSNNAALSQNIEWGQQLIDANNQAIDHLITLTASVESIRDEAANRAHELEKKLKETDISDANWHVIDDERAALAVVIHDLDIKHTEYVTKLFDAHATNAQIRNIIAISQGVKQKSHDTINNVIPEMKKVIVQIEATMDAKRSAETIEAVQNAKRTARAHLNHAAMENTRYVMNIAESPSTSAEEIIATAKSLVAQNNEVIAAIEEGTRKRAEVEQAVATGVVIIDQSVRNRNERIINALMGEAADAEKKQISK